MTQLDLSIIIVSHNSEALLFDTLSSLQTQKGISFEVIVVDNNSRDQTRKMLKEKFPSVKLVPRATSVGFAAANNLGVKKSRADTVLFLNPDIILTSPSDLLNCLTRLQKDSKIGAITPRVNLALTGQIDQTCHRGFPTPWASLTHFTGLGRLFPRSPLFAQYTKSYLGYDREHTIDAVGGMFMMLKREVGAMVGWWDEDYPLYGEDLDLCYRLNQAGYHNLYYPEFTVLHYKGASTGMSQSSRKVSTATKETTRQVKIWSVDAMELFYNKHYRQNNSALVNWLVKIGLKFMYFYRVKLWS